MSSPRKGYRFLDDLDTHADDVFRMRSRDEDDAVAVADDDVACMGDGAIGPLSI